jgi:5-hydroxyisourate hydrolase
MSVSTHVLDASLGTPAAGIAVTLAAQRDGAPDWSEVESGRTDADGRYRFAAGTPAGAYRLTFATGGYFTARGTPAFYPEVAITFTVTDGHFHVPLLLSPFAYSTYRGS